MGLMGFRLILLAALTAATVVSARPHRGKGYNIPWARAKTTVAPYTYRFKKPSLPRPPQHYYSKGSFPEGGRPLPPLRPQGYVPPSRWQNPLNPKGSFAWPMQPLNPKGSFARPMHPLSPKGSFARPMHPLNPKGSLPHPRPPMNPKGTLGRSPIDTLDMPKPKKTLTTQKEKTYSVTYKKHTRYTKQHTGPGHTTKPDKPTVAPGNNPEQRQSSQQTNPSGSAGQTNSRDQRQIPSEQQGQQGNNVDPRPTVGQTPDQGQPPQPSTNPSTSDQFPTGTWQVADPSMQGSTGPWADPPQNQPNTWQVADPSMQGSTGPWADPPQNQPNTWQVADPSMQGTSDPWANPPQNQPNTWQVVDPSNQGQFQDPSSPRVDPQGNQPDTWQIVDPSSQGQRF